MSTNLIIPEHYQPLLNLKHTEQAIRLIKNFFQTDVADPLHYDLVINTGRSSVKDAVEAVSFFWGNKYFKTVEK